MNLINLKYYDELTPQAQAKARRNVTASEAIANSRDIEKAYWQYVASPNRAINDPLHIRRVFNGQTASIKIRKMGDAYLIPFIRSNRIVFTDCGGYVYYLKQFVIIKGCREYIPTSDEQKLLRNPYIDINDRGPVYHAWLYGMHHKVKHFMIR